MITLPYRTLEVQPTPCLFVSVVSPYGAAKHRILFRLDTGADLTAIPASSVHRLRLEPYDRRIVGDYDKRTTMMPTFRVHLRFGEFLFHDVEVVATESNSALLGLDILNQLKVTLDGRKKMLSVE